MTSSSTSLQIPRETRLAVRAPENSRGKIHDLPTDCMLKIFCFLNSREMSLAERVCRYWRSTINTPDQHAWKEQCKNQGIWLIDSDIEIALGPYSSQNAPGEFDSKILSIITGYVSGVTYKTFANFGTLS
jgi:hypothetical protein